MNGVFHEELERFVYGLETLVFIISPPKNKKKSTRHRPPQRPEAFSQSGEHLIVIWVSLHCYHDKRQPEGSIKKTQRGLKGDRD